MRGRGGLLLLGCLAAVAALAAALLPPSDKFALHTQGILHPWLHIVAFAIITALLISGAPTRRLAVILFLATLLLGFATELIEQVVNRSPLELSDIFADTCGACFGLLGVLYRKDR